MPDVATDAADTRLGLDRAGPLVPMALPAKHAVAGDAEPRQRLADEVRDDAQVLGDDLGPGVSEDAQDALTERGLLGLSRQA